MMCLGSIGIGSLVLKNKGSLRGYYFFCYIVALYSFL
jgi:hypothetical protein